MSRIVDVAGGNGEISARLVTYQCHIGGSSACGYRSGIPESRVAQATQEMAGPVERKTSERRSILA